MRAQEQSAVNSSSEKNKYFLTDGVFIFQETDDMTQEMVDILNDAAVEFMGGDLWWTSVEPKEVR